MNHKKEHAFFQFSYDDLTKYTAIGQKNPMEVHGITDRGPAKVPQERDSSI